MREQRKTTEWMSRADMAAHLGVSVRHVARLVQRGKIERKEEKGKHRYRTELKANVIALVPEEKKGSSIDQPTPPTPNDSALFKILLDQLKEQAAENARLRDSLSALEREHTSLQAEHKELQGDHDDLWGVVGDLTTEALELECKLDVLESFHV